MCQVADVAPLDLVGYVSRKRVHRTLTDNIVSARDMTDRRKMKILISKGHDTTPAYRHTSLLSHRPNSPIR